MRNLRKQRQQKTIIRKNKRLKHCNCITSPTQATSEKMKILQAPKVNPEFLIAADQSNSVSLIKIRKLFDNLPKPGTDSNIFSKKGVSQDELKKALQNIIGQENISEIDEKLLELYDL